MFDLRSADGKQQNGNATKRHGESAKSERRKYDSQAGGFLMAAIGDTVWFVYKCEL